MNPQQNLSLKKLSLMCLVLTCIWAFDIPDIELSVLPGKKIKEKVSLQKILQSEPEFDEFMSK